MQTQALAKLDAWRPVTPRGLAGNTSDAKPAERKRTLRKAADDAGTTSPDPSRQHYKGNLGSQDWDACVRRAEYAEQLRSHMQTLQDITRAHPFGCCHELMRIQADRLTKRA